MQQTSANYVEKFNRNVKLLTTILHKQFSKDPIVWKIKGRIETGISVSPVYIMDTVGKYLYEYREQIYQGDIKFFLHNTYEEDIKKSVNEEKVELAKYLIPKIKEAYAVTNCEKRKEYQELVVELLDIYVDYLLDKRTRGV